MNAPAASHCPDSLPAPWTSADIGYVYVPGDICYDSGVYTITASGNDIWDRADAFHSMFRPVPGSSLEIKARIVSVQNTDPWAKCGVMFRSNLDPGSPHVFMAITPGNGAAWQHRNVQSGLSDNLSKGGVQSPYWVRITGNGNKYVGYVSMDGLIWNAMDSVILAMGNHAYVGLAYTSHNNTISGTAVVDHLSVIIPEDTASVRLIDFTGANVNNQYSQLNWTTGYELNFDRFEIEHSTSNTDYKKIGEVPGKGDSQFAQDYGFQDLNPVEGANYYRLKMWDKQGHSSYSRVVIVNFSLAIVQLYPNPAKHMVYLKNNLNFTFGEPLHVELINPLGQSLFKEMIPTSGMNLLKIKFPSAISLGTYFLIAVNSKNQKQVWKIQLQN